MKLATRTTMGLTGVVLITALSACGGGSGETDAEAGNDGNVLTGIFIDSPVSGIAFVTETQSGITSSDGEFSYLVGESVTFSIGDLVFPAISAAPVVTPVDMSVNGDINDNIVVNTATLLQSLDADGDTDNGIQIPPTAAAVSTSIDLNTDPQSFAQDTDVINLVANSGSVNTQILDSAVAVAHLQESISGMTTDTDNNSDPQPADTTSINGIWSLESTTDVTAQRERLNMTLTLSGHGTEAETALALYIDFSAGDDGNPCSTVINGTIDSNGRLGGEADDGDNLVLTFTLSSDGNRLTITTSENVTEQYVRINSVPTSRYRDCSNSDN